MTFKKPTRAGLVALALGVLFALFLSMSVIDRSYAEEAAAPAAAAETPWDVRNATATRTAAASPARIGVVDFMVSSCKGARDQRAAASVSPVRMRTALSRPRMKILPSPICPVLAAAVMASTVLST